MSKSRIARGRKTQRLFADHVSRLWPLAESGPAFEAGPDVENTPGIDFEVKATRNMSLLKALRQSERRANGALSIVVWRPDGYGPKKLGEWVMAMRVDQGLELLREAGYGGTCDVPINQGD